MAEKKQTSVTTVFAGEGAAASTWSVYIRQKECPPDTGMEKKDLYTLGLENSWGTAHSGTTLSVIDGTAYDSLLEEFMSQFGLDSDGNFTTDIYVQTNPETMSYSAKVTRGSFTDEGIQDIEEEEVIPVTFTDYVVTLYKITDVINMEWEGYAYDENGDTTTQPALSFNSENNTIEIASQVVGAIRVKYTTTVHKYTVTVNPKLSTDVDPSTGKLIPLADPYSSVFMVFWTDEFDQARVTQFTLYDCGAQDPYVNTNFHGEVCNQTAGEGLLAAKGRITAPEYEGADPPTYTVDDSGEKIPDSDNVPDCDDTPIEEEYTVMYVAYDYCTGEEITEGVVVTVDGTEVNDIESHVVSKGSHTIKVTADGYKATDADDLTDNDSFEV